VTNNKKNLFSFVLFLVPLGFRFIPCLPLSERVRPFFLLKLSDAKQKKHLLLKQTCKKTIWKQKTIKNSRRKKSASELALFHTKKKSCITAPLFLPNKMARFNSLTLPFLCAATILLVLSGGGGAWGQQEAAELAATDDAGAVSRLVFTCHPAMPLSLSLRRSSLAPSPLDCDQSSSGRYLELFVTLTNANWARRKILSRNKNKQRLLLCRSSPPWRRRRRNPTASCSLRRPSWASPPSSSP